MLSVFAWAILPLDFRVNFGSYEFRPWRLLVMVYGLLFLLAPCILAFAPESPKYLVSQGRYDDALQVLRNIYAGNTRKTPDNYPVSASSVLFTIIFKQIIILSFFYRFFTKYSLFIFLNVWLYLNQRNEYIKYQIYNGAAYCKERTFSLSFASLLVLVVNMFNY